MELILICATVLMSRILAGETSISSMSLRLLNTTYLPSTFNTLNEPTSYGLGKDAAEALAFDPTSKVAYVVGATGYLYVITFNALTGEGSVALAKLVTDREKVTDVAVCNNLVAVSYHGRTVRLNGFVEFYSNFDLKTRSLAFLHRERVGVGPESIVFSSGCETLVVANEGCAGWLDSTNFTSFYNPEGSVSVIRNIKRESETVRCDVVTAGFTKFNDRVSFLEQQGLHFVMERDAFGHTYTLSEDLEPAYVVLSPDDRTAYVALQENNAIAVVDVESATVTEIYGLGRKDHSLTNNGFDTLNDKMVRIRAKPTGVYGLYQPQGMAAFLFEGQTYIVTANEGQSKSYSLDDRAMFSEESVGKSFVGSLTASANASLYGSLINGGDLERLAISNATSKIWNGLYGELYTFGGRSFSVYLNKDGRLSMIYESGSLLAEEHAKRYVTWFNGKSSKDRSLAQSFDSQSEEQGIQPEAIHMANVGGERIVFLGNERTSTIFVFSLEHPSTPRLLTTVTNVNEKMASEEAYNRRQLGDVDPEDFVFIPSESSPVSGRSLLIVAGSYSGTVSVYEVNYTCTYGSLGNDCVPSSGLALVMQTGVTAAGLLLTAVTCLVQIAVVL